MTRFGPFPCKPKALTYGETPLKRFPLPLASFSEWAFAGYTFTRFKGALHHLQELYRSSCSMLSSNANSMQFTSGSSYARQNAAAAESAPRAKDRQPVTDQIRGLLS